MWGRSDVGQLGIIKEEAQSDENGFLVSRPRQVMPFKDMTVEQVALGEAHSLVLDSMGQVYSFGWGDLG